MFDRRMVVTLVSVAFCLLLVAAAALLFQRQERLRNAHNQQSLPNEQQTQANPVALIPPIDKSLKSLPPSSVNSNAIILFCTGDATGGIHYFALNWRDKASRELAFLPPTDAARARNIQVSRNGTLAYTSVDSNHREHLVVRMDSNANVYDAPFHERSVSSWSSDSGATFENRTGFPRFSLSPDGHAIVVYANRDIVYSDTGVGTVFTEFSVACLASGDSSFGPVHSDTMAQSGYMADNAFRRFLAGWFIDDPSSVLFSDFNPGQLYSTTQHLWKFSTATRSYTMLSPQVERYFSTSLDGRFVLYTNNDETCCAGTNYTDNQLILLDLADGSTSVLFDEFESFNNRDLGEDHVPKNGELSPDNQRIATTIHDFIDLNSPTSTPTERDPGVADSLFADAYVLVMRSDGAGEKEYHDRELLGWVDESNLLIRPYSETWDPRAHRWREVYGELRVLNVENGTETPLFTQPVAFVGIQWELQK